MEEKNTLQLNSHREINSVISPANELFFQLKNLSKVFWLDENANKLLETIKPKNQEEFIKNIKILIFLHTRRGKIIKNICKKSKWNLASQINTLLIKWLDFIENIKRWNNHIPSILEKENTEITTLLSNPNKIYETILLENKYPENRKQEKFWDQMFQTINQEIKKRNISNQNFSKWINLINITFKEKAEQMLDLFLDEFGFLPEELYTKLAFNNLGFDTIANFYTILRKKEDQLKKKKGNYIKITQIRNMRSIFLKYMFLNKKGKKNKIIPGICEVANNKSMLQISPDINWVWIKIFKWKKAIVSHLPYAYCDDNLINYWLENQWINKNNFLEIKRQKSLETKDYYTANLYEQKQIESLFSTLSNKKSITLEEKSSYIAKIILENPTKIGKILSEKKLILPSSIIKSILKSNNFDRKELLYKLFLLAESITSNMSYEVLFDKQEMSYTYELAYRSRNARQKRMKYLNNDPRYYNILLIIQEILANNITKNSIEENFMIFYGKYSTRKQNQVFLEVMHNNKSSRILIWEEKHLPKNLRKSLAKIPSLNQSEFENLELLIRSLGLTTESVDIIKNNIPYIKKSNWNLANLFENTIKTVQDVIMFVLNYLPQEYQEFIDIVNRLNWLSSIKDDDIIKFKQTVENFISIIEKLLVKIQNNISEYVHKWDKENYIDFHIKSSELEFNQDFLEKIKEAGLKNYQYSEVLAKSGKSIKIAHINAMETNSINYMAESKAINELQLQEKKPLIVISGWCKNTSKKEMESFQKLNAIIIKVGDKKKANISIPCTQSGIGTSLSKWYINYQDLTVWINETEKMRMFAIAPALSIFIDNNKISENVYAPSTVDQIFLPCSADWDIKSEWIKKAGYFQFIAGAESIYNRLDKQKKRVHIVWNGGLFTIAEVNEAMKNWAQVLLVKWSGRFADIASIGIEHIWELYSILDDRNSLKTIWDYHNYYHQMKEIIKKYAKEDDYQEWLTKDWWEDIELEDNVENQEIESFEQYFQVVWNQNGINHKHILYRQYFENFFNLSLNSYNLPIVSGIDDLEGNLDGLI